MMGPEFKPSVIKIAFKFFGKNFRLSYPDAKLEQTSY